MEALNILHIDMDAFFAAVEQRDNPDIRGKPVIIGGTALAKRGVVSTASYEARVFGVHSAMPIVEAKRLCPNGIYLPGSMSKYIEASRQIFEIFNKFTPLVEKLSIDEAFLDISGCHRLFGNSIEIGEQIKQEIKAQIGLTASVGIAPNKFLAKLASDMEKPDGFVIIKKEEIEETLDSLPISNLWGVGGKTEKVLRGRGIKTIGMLRSISLIDLENLLGKMGEKLYYLARGKDNRKVISTTDIKSISHEETFLENLTDKEEIFAVLLNLTQKVVRRLRNKNLRGNTVFIKVRYDDFTTVTRRNTMTCPVNNIDDIYREGKNLLLKDKLINRPVRLLGIGAGNLCSNKNKQLSLFAEKDREKLSLTIESIKNKYGDRSIRRARNLFHKKDK